MDDKYHKKASPQTEKISETNWNEKKKKLRNSCFEKLFKK